ncbi:BON domain-containing protein [Apibacter raozihei]|uniref:BON domain-containing protein n=1 Tax=Apibacter TaxID=1778601 RepID=UPI000FE3F99B|nr:MULTISPECIES: BON domain-containing protein [Apibacter]
MKQLSKFLVAFAIMGSLTVAVTSCKSGPKDSELTTQAQAVLPEGVTIDVKKGVATLTGEFNDDIAQQSAENALKAIPGIKTVENKATVKAVVVSADEELKAKINTVLKNYAGVTADVKDGVVTLNGELQRVDLPKLMQAVTMLQPKKVEQKLTLK